MITSHDVRLRGADILLGIAVENAVLDILTSEPHLRECLNVLNKAQTALVSLHIGTFGCYPVTLSVHPEDTVSIFIDGPEFEPSREQCSAIWLGKNELQQLLVELLKESGKKESS